LGLQIAFGISESELLLRRAGARHFLIPNLFNVGLLPASVAAGNSAFATAATNATNQSLNGLLAVESLIEGIHILRADVFSVENAVTTDPSHFGFTDVTDPCLTPSTVQNVPPVVCSNPYVTFFWDVEHPTVFGHAFFAVTAVNALTAQGW
jgi:phospholipase/lecithinase/hemolysin